MLAAGFLALLAAPVQGDVGTSTLTDDLRAAIALPTPKERRAAALGIARRRDASIESVLFAIAAVSAREPAPAGSHIENAHILAGDKVEDVELAVYVPKSYDPRTAAPLIASFHGTGGSGRGLERLWQDVSEAIGAIVVAPGEAGPNEGYAFSMRERDAALGAVRWACATFAIDTNRVYAGGISRGGHLTWDLALRRPDRFAAIAPLLGCPRFQLVRGQNNLRFLENLVEVPIRDLQGSKDDPGVLQNLHEAFAKLESLHARDAKLIEFANKGHDFDFSAVDWPAFFTAVREPSPEKVVFTSANLAEARSHWVEITQFTKDVSEDPRIDAQSGAWGKLDAAGQRRFVEERIEAGTARVEAHRTGRGRFEVMTRGVAKLRLLLAADAFDPRENVEVYLGGKPIRRKVVPDVKVLLTEYVERLDRSFLPVASLEIP